MHVRRSMRECGNEWMVSFSWLCLHTIFLTLLICISSMIEAQGSSLVPCQEIVPSIQTLVDLAPWRTASPASPASPSPSPWHLWFGRTCASRGPRRCCFVRLPREPDGSERLMPCSGWSTPVYLQHGGLQSWSSLVLLASVRFGQPSRTSGNTVASRPRSQHCHLRLPGSK